MLEETFKETADLLRTTDKLLRRLEKTSKVLTQHVQTSILTFKMMESKNNE